MKSLDQWLAEYGESHQNETNKLVHWICVPTIFFSDGPVILYQATFSLGGQPVNMACIAMLMITVLRPAFQNDLDWHACFGIARLGFVVDRNLGCLAFWAVCAGLLYWPDRAILRAFGGGKSLHFLKDLQFLLIGQPG